MQAIEANQFQDFDPAQEQMLVMKHAVNSLPNHTTTLRLNGLYDSLTKKLIPSGQQIYAVCDEMTIYELRQKWYQSNIKKLFDNDRTVEQYVLTYNLDFALDPTETIGDIRKKLQKQQFDSNAVIRVYYEWDCPLEEDQAAGFSYDHYEMKNLSQIQTTFKFRSTAPHNSCYFYVKTFLKTNIQELKKYILDYLSFANQKSIIKSKTPLDKSSFRLFIKKDGIKPQQLKQIYNNMEEEKIYYDLKSDELDFTNLNDLKIRDICPPGETIYIEFEDENSVQVNKGLQKHKNKKIKIVCYENVDKSKSVSPTGQQKIIEQKVIQRLFSQIRNLKVHTLLHEERIKYPLTTSISCSEMTIKPQDTFQKFQKQILQYPQEVLNLYTYPENFLYYKAIHDLESITMEKIIQTLKDKDVLKEDARCKCRQKRQQYRKRIDPVFQAQDFLDPIVLYTSPYIYPAFNTNLRGTSISLVQKQTIIDSLQKLWHYPFSEKLIKSLNKLPNHQGKVFRVSVQHNYNFKDDQVFEWNSFTSTTKQYKVGAKFLQGMLKKPQNTGTSSNLTYIFEIDAYSGKDIEMFSFYGSQKEVLLMPYSKFKIMSQGMATLWKEKIQVTWVHAVQIPIPKKIPGNIVVWIDANIQQNSKAFNRIIQTNNYTDCDLIQLVSNEHFQLWLQQFKQTLSLPGVNVQFISNMNRPPYFKQEGLNTLEIIRSFNQQAKVIFYIGNVAKTRDILSKYWEEQKLPEDKNIEVVQNLKVLNSVFQSIIESQKSKIK